MALVRIGVVLWSSLFQYLVLSEIDLYAELTVGMSGIFTLLYLISALNAFKSKMYR